MKCLMLSLLAALSDSRFRLRDRAPIYSMDKRFDGF